MFYLIIGCALLLLGLYFLRIALLGRSPENLAATTGTLVKASGFRNVPMRYGGVIKNQTDFTYAYTVDGKTYRRSGRKNAHRRTIPKTVTIVYVKTYPRGGYIGRFTGLYEWVYALSCLIYSVLFILLFFLSRT